MRILRGLLPGHVLQRTPRGAAATVRGEAAASGTVTATITAGRRRLRGWSATAVGTARGGVFTARLRGLPTGGPFIVTLAVGAERVSVRDVFVGDLWLIAGQSNAEGLGNLADRPAPHRLVRSFAMAREWRLATDPLHHVYESPDRCHHGGRQETPAEARRHRARRIKGTGFGVWFGREMVRRHGVPQGLIAAAHGGTRLELWDPARRDQGGDSLYASMLASIEAVGQPLAGVLWYQGESDAGAGAVPEYAPRMQALVATLRADLRQPRLPWVVVQLGRHVATVGGREWNAIQELQRRLPETIPRLAVLPAVDLATDDAIHIGGAAFATLAARLARAASRLVHGADEPPPIQPLGARYVEGHSRGPRIEVRFAHAVGGLRSNGRPLGFAVVDAEHQAHDLIAKTELAGDRVFLELVTTDRRDLRVMYGHGRNPTCTVTDARGMAVPVFGPLHIAEPAPPSPWLMRWEVSDVRPGEDIAVMPLPTPETVGPMPVHVFQPGPGFFVNQNGQWAGRSGHAALRTEVDVAEAMRVELRLGYDGPIRVWIDETEVLADPRGSRPAIADARRIPLRLSAGRHRVTVLMALDRGLAWGFFMRFVRIGLGRAALARGTVAVPQLIV